jgi:hypothetical protein
MSRLPNKGRVSRNPLPNSPEFESWCLSQSVALGTWAAAGLNPEFSPSGVLLGYWKFLRDGSLLVIDVGAS